MWMWVCVWVCAWVCEWVCYRVSVLSVIIVLLVLVLRPGLVLCSSTRCWRSSNCWPRRWWRNWRLRWARRWACASCGDKNYRLMVLLWSVVMCGGAWRASKRLCRSTWQTENYTMPCTRLWQVAHLPADCAYVYILSHSSHVYPQLSCMLLQKRLAAALTKLLWTQWWTQDVSTFKMWY